MERQNSTLTPAAVEAINQISGAYSTLFWDGLLAVTESLDTVKSVKVAVEVLHNEKKDDVAYYLILAMYDLAAIEIPMTIIEMEPYPKGIDQFISEFLSDAEDLMFDYENETSTSNN